MASNKATDDGENATSDLRPLKAIIVGPPASGKTTLSQWLCRRYGAHYVTARTMVQETLEELRGNIERELQAKRRTAKEDRAAYGEDEAGEEEGESDEDLQRSEEEEDEDAIGDVEVWQEQVRDITAMLARCEDGRMPDDYVIRMMRSFLAKDVCQSRGYVLDGFPETIQQARELFGQATELSQKQKREEVPRGVEGEDQAVQDQVGGMIGNASDKLLPNFVVSLEADDDFLCDRVMRLPQKNIEETAYDEAAMLKNLSEYRSNNTESNTVLRFFDEHDIHPILIELEVDGEPKDILSILDYLYKIFGEPIPGFGITAEEEERIRKLELEAKKLDDEKQKIERQLLEERATKEYQQKMESWSDVFQKLQDEEEKILAAQSEPLRFYLMKYVFPTLCKGLIEVARIKPDDPIDFLAEYLFRENPEGKMFDPSYTREGEKILDAYENEVETAFEE